MYAIQIRKRSFNIFIPLGDLNTFDGDALSEHVQSRDADVINFNFDGW